MKAQEQPGHAMARGELAFVPMEASVLPLIAEVEKTVYAHPWSLRHFSDSLASGHLAQMLVAPAAPGETGAQGRTAPLLPDGRRLLGYLVAMQGVDEVHLLNIATVPMQRRQGWARLMLQALADWAVGRGAHWLWLEVRASNQPARSLYESLGLQQVGLRRGYYPDAGERREDAVVMSWNLKTRGATLQGERAPVLAEAEGALR